MFIIYLAAFGVVQSLRHSPQTPDSIIASIRSGVMLPANRLVKEGWHVCDSLTDGPFCGVVSAVGAPSVEGIIDRKLWGGIPHDIYQAAYGQLADFAQNHWSGSPLVAPRPVRTSSLTNRSDALFVFQPHGVVVDTAHWSPSSSSGLYVLNSFFGYISFVHSAVSVVEFVVKAPSSSAVLVRAFNNGHLMWARIVPSGGVLDVAASSPSVDPSLESIAYLEIIGVGAEILSLTVSLPSSRTAATYMFMDTDLSRPTKYAGVRLFDSSAFLLDMESAARQGLRVKPVDLVVDALFHPVLSYASFAEKLSRTATPESNVYVHHLIASIEAFLHNGARNDRSFDAVFSTVLVESSPEVVSLALADTNINIVSSTTNENIHRLKGLKARFDGASTLVEPAIIETIISSLGDLGRVSFLQAVANPVPPAVTQSASQVVVALYAHLGEQRFTEIIIRNRLVRMSNAEPVATDGIDEQTLTEILVEGLGLPITPTTPLSYKKELLTRVISILTNGDETGSAMLAEILVM